MQNNVGSTDMVIRLVASVFFLYIGFFDNPIVSSGLSKKIMVGVALAPLLSGIFRSCPLYALIGLNTCADCKKND